MACMNKRRQFLILVVLLCTIGFNIPGLAEEADPTLMESGVSEFSNPIQNSIFSLSNSVPPLKYSMGNTFQKILAEKNAVIIPVPISFGPLGVNRIEIIVPNHWKKGIRVGTFYDQFLGITWVYDRNLQTCFSPEKGWVLVTEYSTERIPLAQYYFDMDRKILFDIRTGLPLTGGTPGEASPSPNTAAQTATEPEPTGLPVVTSTGGPAQTDQCITECSVCPSGFCHDCNGNGICDEEEETTPVSQPTQSQSLPSPQITQTSSQPPVYTPKPTQSPQIISVQTQMPVQTPYVTSTKTPTLTITPTPTQTIQSISEQPQVPIQPTQPPQPGPTESELSEEPQAPIQISLIPDIFEEDTTDQPDDSDSISETPQSTILYYQLPKGKGPFKVILCPIGGDCIYCIDENENKICDISECYLIICDNPDECNYCIDCDRDMVCDLDKMIIRNCYPDEPCEEIDYCVDKNQNFRCDSDENVEEVEEDLDNYPIISDWGSISWN